MTARRTRRMSSSLFPANITPEMTSIQPGRVPWNMASWRLETGGGRVAAGGRGVKEVLVSCGFSRHTPILWRDFGLFGRPPEKRGETSRLSPALSPPQGDRVNKAELTAALAMRTKMSKADATRTIDALFDDKGIIAGELKKGAKVQITGFGNFEARKRAARMGRNPKTGGTIQIKASIAPAFRAGKQLKMALNNKR